MNQRIKKAFETYTDKAERFKKAEGWSEALTNYRLALLLMPSDDQTIKAIKECENRKKN